MAVVAAALLPDLVVMRRVDFCCMTLEALKEKSTSSASTDGVSMLGSLFPALPPPQRARKSWC